MRNGMARCCHIRQMTIYTASISWTKVELTANSPLNTSPAHAAPA